MFRTHRAPVKDVAHDVGVSPQTVSRVLNNRPDVAAVTRQRIEEAINRFNYHPSAIARSLWQWLALITSPLPPHIYGHPLPRSSRIRRSWASLRYTS
jgi:hypothetical protein